MPSKLNSVSTGTPSLKFTAAGDGALEIQNDGNTAITVAANGNVTLSGDLSLSGNMTVQSGASIKPVGISDGGLTFNGSEISARSLTISNINNTENFTKINVYGFGDNRGFGIVFRPSVTNGTPCWFLNQSGTQVGQITTNASATTYTTTSDYRLKGNIQPLEGGLDKVMLLKPSTWNWEDGSLGEGFIAHELQEHVPSAVIGQKDQVDSEGNPVYQSVDTSYVIATLTKAIQELKQQLDIANARIQALENS
jgi:hypothetical protein